jgi:hypothetical protein
VPRPPSPTPRTRPTPTTSSHPVCAVGYAWSTDRCLRTTVDPRPTDEPGWYTAPRVSARFVSCVPTPTDVTMDTAVFDLTIVGGTAWDPLTQGLTQVSGSCWRWVADWAPGDVAVLSAIVIFGNDYTRQVVLLPRRRATAPSRARRALALLVRSGQPIPWPT